MTDSLVVLAATAAIAAIGAAVAEPRQTDVPTVGARWELMVDRALLDRLDGCSLALAPPERREVVLVTDRPWEGPASAYYTVLRDGGMIRLYYRGNCLGDDSSQQVTCVAESTDGVHFARPELGIFEFGGSSKNNIVFRGVEAHNFAPFIDANPAAKPAERYKAVAGINSKLYAYASPDGLRWERLQEEPVLTKGAFDSLNIAFWDPIARLYRLYSRYWSGVRAIQSCTSTDFVHWTDPVPNGYAPGAPSEHFYTNAVWPCPGAEHILLSFPKRFVPERKKLRNYKEPGVSDAVFLSSRDGVRWNREFLEAWVRPGRDERNWTQRSNMPAWGIVATGTDEFSMYISEHYEWPDNRLRRLVIPRHRFASVRSGAGGGMATTTPLRIAGGRLALNYATSAAGSIQVEVLDESGAPIGGFGRQDMAPLFGDEIEAEVRWTSADLASLKGRVVRLRFVLKDADLYAFRSAER